MLHIQSSIEIANSPAEVYRLLADSERKARLNPDIEVLKIAQVTNGPLTVGTRTFFRLRTATGIRSFHSDVVACEPNRYIEWLSDSQPAFRVRQSLEPVARGCRLVHEEWLETLPENTVASSRNVLFEIADAFEHAASVDMTPNLANPAEELRRSMQARLAIWLANIKSHLEVPQTQTEIDFEQEIVVGF